MTSDGVTWGSAERCGTSAVLPRRPSHDEIAAAHGIGARRVRAPAGCCRPRPNCRSLRRQSGHRASGARSAARRGAGGIATGLRLVRRRRSRCASRSAARHHRSAARRIRASRPNVACSGFAFVAPPPRVRARARLRRRCSRYAASTWPMTANRSPASPCGAPSVRAAPVSRRGRGSPFYELIERAARRGDADDRCGRGRADTDAALLGIPVGSPVLVCERVTRSIAMDVPVLRERARVPRPPHRVLRRAAQREASMAPSGLRLVRVRPRLFPFWRLRRRLRRRAGRAVRLVWVLSAAWFAGSRSADLGDHFVGVPAEHAQLFGEGLRVGPGLIGVPEPDDHVADATFFEAFDPIG